MPCPVMIRFRHAPQSRALFMTALLVAVVSTPPVSVPQVQAAEASRRTLQLSATGEVTAVPDMAVVTLGMETQAKTARDALAANTRAMRKVFDLLEKTWQVAERDMATSRFSVSPVYVPQKLPDGTVRHRLDGYRVTNMLTIRVRRLENLGGILDSVVEAGSNRVESIHFAFSDPDRLKDEALKNAMRKALKKARIMATEAGFALGPVISVRESGARPLPPVPVLRRTIMARSEGMPVPVARGEGKIAVTVSMTWEIR